MRLKEEFSTGEISCKFIHLRLDLLERDAFFRIEFGEASHDQARLHEELAAHLCVATGGGDELGSEQTCDGIAIDELVAYHEVQQKTHQPRVHLLSVDAAVLDQLGREKAVRPAVLGKLSFLLGTNANILSLESRFPFATSNDLMNFPVLILEKLCFKGIITLNSKDL